MKKNNYKVNKIIAQYILNNRILYNKKNLNLSDQKERNLYEIKTLNWRDLIQLTIIS